MLGKGGGEDKIKLQKPTYKLTELYRDSSLIIHDGGMIFPCFTSSEAMLGQRSMLRPCGRAKEGKNNGYATSYRL
jgi:hypothetical protein